MFTYSQAIEFLYQKLPIFHNQGQKALKPGLKNIIALCNSLDNPQKKFPSIHIAGTNGKGSTSHLLAAAFQQNGFKTGLYTSPHLIDLRERIRVNGCPVAKEFIIQFIEDKKQIIEEIKPSYFEITVAMAFEAFANENVEIAIIETGLGGRLDSTNIITPILSIITNIGLDHMDILGDTIEQIAVEKAGIIKEKIPVLIGEKQPETERLFIEKAFINHSAIFFAENFWELILLQNNFSSQDFKAIDLGKRKIFSLKTDLLGSFQVHNLKTVLAALTILKNSGWNLSIEKSIESFHKVKIITGLRGRWEWWQTKPNIILDVAHNASGMHYLIDNLNSLKLNPSGKLHIILGFVKDKDIAAALDPFPKSAEFYFTQAQIPRALPAEELHIIGVSKDLSGQAFKQVSDALKRSLEMAKEIDTILVTGSFFIVGEALEILEKKSLD